GFPVDLDAHELVDLVLAFTARRHGRSPRRRFYARRGAKSVAPHVRGRAWLRVFGLLRPGSPKAPNSATFEAASTRGPRRGSRGGTPVLEGRRGVADLIIRGGAGRGGGAEASQWASSTGWARSSRATSTPCSTRPRTTRSCSSSTWKRWRSS